MRFSFVWINNIYPIAPVQIGYTSNYMVYNQESLILLTQDPRKDIAGKGLSLKIFLYIENPKTQTTNPTCYHGHYIW